MKKIVIIALILCAVAACSKDKFNTKPQIEINSYSTKVVPPNEDVVIQLKYTDKEGDLGTGKFIYIPVRANRRITREKSYDPDSSLVPQYPGNSTGFFNVTIRWKDMHQAYILENDSIYFRFVVYDKAGNKSDTVNSDRVVFLQQ